jgi:hypothetical protein
MKGTLACLFAGAISVGNVWGMVCGLVWERSWHRRGRSTGQFFGLVPGAPGRRLVILAQIVFSVQIAWTGELTAISSKFVASAKEGNLENLASTLWDGGPAKDEMIAEFKKVAPEIQKEKLKLTKVDRELVIGELGVTLMRLDAEGDNDPSYNPIICLKVQGKWFIFPCGTEKHLKVLFDQRSKEEQIHLKLFNEWSNLMGKLLAEEAEQPGADHPATKPADRPPAKNQPSTPTSKDGSR